MYETCSLMVMYRPIDGGVHSRRVLYCTYRVDHTRTSTVHVFVFVVQDRLSFITIIFLPFHHTWMDLSLRLNRFNRSVSFDTSRLSGEWRGRGIRTGVQDPERPNLHVLIFIACIVDPIIFDAHTAMLSSARLLVVALAALACVAHPVAASNAKGEAFLEENAKKDGVITLASGLQYKVIKSSTKEGALTPRANSPCTCHYAGTLIDGTEFDSSIRRNRPSTFAPNQVIKGWTEAMQLMKEGDEWELYIPSELGYGNSNRGQYIRAGDVLIFTLNLIKVNNGGFVKEDL